MQEDTMALSDTSGPCCSHTSNVSNHLVSILCLACGVFTTVTLETAKPVHLERVRPVLLTYTSVF